MPNVSDTELDTAAETFEEEVEEEVEEPDEEHPAEEEEEVVEEIEEEPEDNSERSRLGRKVAKLNEDIAEIKELIKSNPNRQTTETIEEDIDGDTLVTYAEMQTFLKKAKEEEKSKEESYNSDYISAVYALADEFEEEDEELVQKILSAMDSNFKTIYSTNATVDAEKNFNKAMRAVLRGPVEKKNPLKGKKPAASTNVSTGEHVKPKNIEVPELDDYAKEFVKRTGMNEESVSRALTRTLPTYLRK